MMQCLQPGYTKSLAWGWDITCDLYGSHRGHHRHLDYELGIVIYWAVTQEKASAEEEITPQGESALPGDGAVPGVRAPNPVLPGTDDRTTAVLL